MRYKIKDLFCFEKTEGGWVLTKYNFCGAAEIKIPAEYKGAPVVCIGKGAFQFSYIKRVVIPDSVTKIEENAFSWAWDLESVDIPDTVTEIGDYAFDCCELSDIHIPKNIVRIGKNAFSGNRITSAVFPESLEELDDGAFSSCFCLESVTFNSAPRFGSDVFYGCEKLPADITLMGLVNSADITAPLDTEAFNTYFEIDWSATKPYEQNIYTRPDVFELAIKNDCFRSVDVSLLLKFLVEAGFTDRLLCAENHGLFDDIALLGELTEYSVRQGSPEVTAYLLDLKKRKFGFDKEDNYVL